jgi:glycosyltransferase involved in cell wall biosynthesis
MRLTLLSHFIGRGGSTGFFLQLRDFFQSCGHEVSLVVGYDAPDPMAERYHVVPSGKGQTWRERMREYVRVVEQTKPDVVYTVSGQDEFEVFRFLQVPRALHCGCIERHEYADLPLWHRQLEPYTELRCTHTPDLLDKVKGDPRYNIKLAYVPHRLPEIFLHAPDVKPWRPQDAQRPVEVCFLSRLEKFQKRAHWLPKIMQACQRAGANLRWHIYGTGPAEAELSNGIQKAGLTPVVFFHGWQEPEQLAPQLCQHDVFFLCSRWEGLPAAMVEAMLSGQACVVPNFPAGMTFMVKDGGGWAYEADSPERSARALLDALGNREVLWRKRCEAQKISRSLHARDVIDGHLHHVEGLLKDLEYNGNSCSLQTAHRMAIVRFPVLLQRRWLELKGRVAQLTQRTVTA